MSVPEPHHLRRRRPLLPRPPSSPPFLTHLLLSLYHQARQGPQWAEECQTAEGGGGSRGEHGPGGVVTEEINRDRQAWCICRTLGGGGRGRSWSGKATAVKTLDCDTAWVWGLTSPWDAGLINCRSSCLPPCFWLESASSPTPTPNPIPPPSPEFLVTHRSEGAKLTNRVEER